MSTVSLPLPFKIDLSFPTALLPLVEFLTAVKAHSVNGTRVTYMLHVCSRLMLRLKLFAREKDQNGRPSVHRLCTSHVSLFLLFLFELVSLHFLCAYFGLDREAFTGWGGGGSSGFGGVVQRMSITEHWMCVCTGVTSAIFGICNFVYKFAVSALSSWVVITFWRPSLENLL